MVNMILDLDTGIDDAMALAYAVSNPEINLIGVTCTYGNVKTADGGRNALNLLGMMHADSIPVYLGQEHAFHKGPFTPSPVSQRIHGENGVANRDIVQTTKKPETQDAVDFLIESIHTLKQDLTIVTTGPLTNVATALQKDPSIKDHIGKVVVMGGALTVPGNVNEFCEANIHQDPIAAHFVCTSGIDVTIVPLDVTQRSLLTTEHTKQWRKTGTELGNTYAAMVEYYISQHIHNVPFTCFIHDPSAAICAVYPHLFTMLSLNVKVITTGISEGRLTGDPDRLYDEHPQTKVCIGVDSKKLVPHLHTTLMKLFERNI